MTTTTTTTTTSPACVASGVQQAGTRRPDTCGHVVLRAHGQRHPRCSGRLDSAHFHSSWVRACRPPPALADVHAGSDARCPGVRRNLSTSRFSKPMCPVCSAGVGVLPAVLASSATQDVLWADNHADRNLCNPSRAGARKLWASALRCVSVCWTKCHWKQAAQPFLLQLQLTSILELELALDLVLVLVL